MEENNGKIRKRLYKDMPLAGINLNEFERPGGDYFTNLRRFCISIGVISPGESRVGIVHILDVLLKARKEHPQGLDSYSIVKELYKTDVKIVYANILRDVRKLIAVGLVEKRDTKYRIKENLNLSDILDSFIKPYIVDRILKRISEYAARLDDQINKQ
jgi:hypothetical protein